MTEFEKNQPAPAKDERLTPEQAAAYLGLATSTLRDWRSINYHGHSPAFYRLGRRVFYVMDDLERYLASCRVTHKTRR